MRTVHKRHTGRPPAAESDRRARHYAVLLAQDLTESGDWQTSTWRLRQHAVTARIDEGRALDLLACPVFRAQVEGLAGVVGEQVAA